ncbi:Testis-expressed sequence 11 protein [Liparis tanakae]|uniref:Protein ZIP4 homolog n=1 Tax=Liparis tanakae TaxID=230148 RepID=A0A4Z2HEV4_9TELE|nr:Testis-expressed sequence 11 protein [Liparis tanakae]
MLESKVSLDLCLSTVKLLMLEDRETLAFEYLKRVCQHFEASPDLGSALVLHIELLLQRGKELLAKQKIEDIINGHYTGKQLSPLALTSLHVMLWDKASTHFEWYNYSLSFFKAGHMEPNSAKLQRNRASCFLQLKQLEKAKDAIKEAERCDPGSIFTQFSVYKIAVQEKDVERAAEAVNAMGLLSRSPAAREDGPLVSEKAAFNLLSLAAQIALENEQQETAMKALESLCENSEDEAQVLTALRPYLTGRTLQAETLQAVPYRPYLTGRTLQAETLQAVPYRPYLTGRTRVSRVPQMSGLYTEILDRLDKAQKNLVMEE